MLACRLAAGTLLIILILIQNQMAAGGIDDDILPLDLDGFESAVLSAFGAQQRLLGRLKQKLFKNYDKDIRPAMNVSDVVTVKVDSVVRQIIDVNEELNEIVMKVWIQYEWIDYRLTWDPAEYGSIETLRLRNNLLWQPNVIIIGKGDITSDPHPAKAVISHDGTILRTVPRTFTSDCRTKKTNFPYDEYSCPFMFTADLSVDQLALEYGRPGKYSFDVEQTHSSFTVTNTSIEKLDSCFEGTCHEPLLYNIVTLRRNPGFFVHFYVSPAVVMLLLMPFVFLVRPGSARGTILGTGVMICCSLFILHAMDPHTARKSPYIMIYYSSVFIMETLCLALYVVTGALFSHVLTSSPPPNIHSLFVCTLGRFVSVKTEEFRDVVVRKTEKVDVRADRKAQWQALATTVNRLAFGVLMGTNVIITLCILA